MNAIIQHSVLIVSGTQKGAAYITELLSPREFAPMTTALSGGDARRLLLRRSYDLVVINTPLPDEFGHELAEYITEKFVSGVMVIAKAELFDQVNAGNFGEIEAGYNERYWAFRDDLQNLLQTAG